VTPMRRPSTGVLPVVAARARAASYRRGAVESGWMITSGWARARRVRSLTSPVSTTPPRRATASATISASTVALLVAAASNAPAIRARSSVAGATVPTALSTRLTGASRGPLPRTVSAMTTAGTTTSTPASHAAARAARARGSCRASASTAPESRIRQDGGGVFGVRRAAIPAVLRPGDPREPDRIRHPSRREDRRGGRAGDVGGGHR
jgi:hypothetical protein